MSIAKSFTCEVVSACSALGCSAFARIASSLRIESPTDQLLPPAAAPSGGCTHSAYSGRAARDPLGASSAPPSPAAASLLGGSTCVHRS